MASKKSEKSGAPRKSRSKRESTEIQGNSGISEDQTDTENEETTEDYGTTGGNEGGLECRLQRIEKIVAGITPTLQKDIKSLTGFGHRDYRLAG